MEIFRLCRQKHAAILSGKGAAIKGARWNSVGVEIIYCAANRSLAMAEVAVHFSLASIPSDYMMMTIFVPDSIAIQVLDAKHLPTDWNEFPYNNATQSFGDDFISENKCCILQVPSVVTQGDYNLLINPQYKYFNQIQITAVEKFPFDKRIFK
jgi:RES domain-containing protein